MGLRHLAILIYRERNALSEHVIYVSLAVYFLATTLLLMLRSNIVLRAYFWIASSSTALFAIAFFQATGLVEELIIFLLIIGALTVQIQLQIAEENSLRVLPLPKLRSQFIAMRHWLVVLFGASLLLALNAGGANLLTLLARQTNNEVIKNILLWLRAPVALYVCMVIFEFLRTYLLRLQLLATPRSEGRVLKLIQGVAEKYSLKFTRLYQINLEQYDFNTLIGHKGNIFFSESLVDKLNPEEMEYLVVRGLIYGRLNLESQRIIHYTIFSVTLFLPYFLLGQTLDYLLPLVWALPIWKLLYILLFTAQHFLKKGIDTLQFETRSQTAAVTVGLNEGAVRALHLKLNSFNRVQRKSVVVFGLPRAHPLPVEKQWESKFYSLKLGQFNFTRAARNSVIFTAVVFVVSTLMLKSRYELRHGAAEGDLATVSRCLDRGLSPDSVDVLSNVAPTPLLAAAQRGQEKTVAFLLARGADPNKKVPVDFSPLVFAAMSGDLSMVKELISHGAKINFRGVKGYTALMWAARLKQVEIVKFLIANGALLNIRSDHHSTALMLAIGAPQNSEVIRTLIESGADIEVRDLDGDTALEIAKRKHFDTELGWLRAALSEKSRRLPASK